MATVSVSKKSTTSPEESITYLREKKPRPYNPWWIVTSILVVTTISIALYVLPDWLFLAYWTRDLVVGILQFMGYPAHYTGAADGFATFPWSPQWGAFGEAFPNTPGVSIDGSEYPAYWIVKACTGFQAGAILIALIIVTPLKSKSLPADVDPALVSSYRRFQANHQTLYNMGKKFTVIGIFWFVLFVTNTIRIAFHLWLVSGFELFGFTFGPYPFAIAHDELAKPIGFFGTLLFAWVIEKSGVPIIDTFADWLDAFFYGVKGSLSWVKNILRI
ncbi:MAG: hypothetical protein HeimC3_01220 [Candidatus Heimdallarchaeota archaeon LC_3]|nr:MAG: hypothetical protein HeimC3_48880 [Candidatus Heimdallarchaeota archaeon LC_3]OLS27959.1 MAG: hypothetical protein HeimC3_01220 [Candidatus Heimdallarchaeota archaeon LC_3]